MVRAFGLPIFSVVTVLSAYAAWAGESAHDWLVKIAHAARQHDYEGTFIYRQETRLDTLRIVHKVVDGAVRERLVSLSGVPREIVRDKGEVRCYYPEDNAVVVQRRNEAERNFPGILPERVRGIEENYIIQLGRSGRVAGRPAQQVLIRPRDKYRYGYHLWADRDTGLLLKAELVDDNDRLLEQFLFTQIHIGGDIPGAALVSQAERTDMIWHRDGGERVDGASLAWTVTHLPKGFKLSSQTLRQFSARRKAMEHLVFSDGLAAVSVFVEKYAGGGKGDFVQGSNRIGVVNAYGKRIDGFYVTIIGEVPAAAVSLIGESVARRP